MIGRRGLRLDEADVDRALRPIRRRPDSRISSQQRRLAQSMPSGIDPPLEAVRRGAVQVQVRGGGADGERG